MAAVRGYFGLKLCYVTLMLLPSVNFWFLQSSSAIFSLSPLIYMRCTLTHMLTLLLPFAVKGLIYVRLVMTKVASFAELRKAKDLVRI